MLQRDVQVLFKLTQAEQFQLVRTAQDAGLSTAAFIRKCCLSAEHVTIVNRELLKDIYFELNHIGVNVNQIAYMANALHKISDEQIREMLGWQKELCKIINTKLGGTKSEKI